MRFLSEYLGRETNLYLRLHTGTIDVFMNEGDARHFKTGINNPNSEHCLGSYHIKNAHQKHSAGQC